MENRGGAREGAGRKPLLDLSGTQREEIIKQVKAVAEKYGTSLGEVLGEMMFSGKDRRTKLAAMRLYVGDVLPKVSESHKEVTDHTKPQVFTPEKYPDSDDAPQYRPSH